MEYKCHDLMESEQIRFWRGQSTRNVNLLAYISSTKFSEQGSEK